MSAVADAPAVDLRATVGSTKPRLSRTAWLVVGTTVMSATDAVGVALLPSNVHLPDWAMLLMSTNLLVLNRVVEHMSLGSFLLLALIRPLVGLPLHYYLGQDVAFMASKRFKHRRTNRLTGRLRHRLANAGHGFILAAIFGLKFVPKPPPPASWAFAVADPVPYAGAAHTRLRWVLLVDVAACLVYLTLFAQYGHDVFESLHWLY